MRWRPLRLAALACAARGARALDAGRGAARLELDQEAWRWPQFAQVWDKIVKSIERANVRQQEGDSAWAGEVAENISVAFNEALSIVQEESDRFLNRTTEARHRLSGMAAGLIKAAVADWAWPKNKALQKKPNLQLERYQNEFLKFIDDDVADIENLDAVFRSFHSIMIRALDTGGRPEFAAALNDTLSYALAEGLEPLVTRMHKAKEIMFDAPQLPGSNPEMNSTLEEGADIIQVFGEHFEKAFQDLADTVHQALERSVTDPGQGRVSVAFGGTLQKVHKIVWSVHSGFREVTRVMMKAAEVISYHPEGRQLVAEKEHAWRDDNISATSMPNDRRGNHSSACSRRAPGLLVLEALALAAVVDCSLQRLRWV